ncbi:IS3 family transposase [Streptomyces sp. NPDC002688]|uniref:IS3 family transposase n=1 Tax=Streptomyces sp. NPDC002688 TaxID=3154423 RepID=UPI00332C533C
MADAPGAALKRDVLPGKGLELSAELLLVALDDHGSPRVHALLKREGVHVGRKRVERLMRQAGLAGISPRKTKSFTRRDPDADLAPDLVQRDFTASGPNRLWVTDLTMITTEEGPLWLSAIRDAFSRRVVAWETSARADADLVLTTLECSRCASTVASGSPARCERARRHRNHCPPSAPRWDAPSALRGRVCGEFPAGGKEPPCRGCCGRRQGTAGFRQCVHRGDPRVTVRETRHRSEVDGTAATADATRNGPPPRVSRADFGPVEDTLDVGADVPAGHL